MSILSAQLINKIIKGELCQDQSRVNLQTIHFFPPGTADKNNPGQKTTCSLLGNGDNLQLLTALWQDQKQKDLFHTKNRIKLIYIDPPFATNKNFDQLQTRAYSDKLTGSSFLEFMACRLSLLHRILAEDGSIYVHIDWKYAHYIKLILDLIFGADNFKNEIIWHFQSGGRTRNFFARKHASIFYYVKSAKTPFYGDAVAVNRGHAKKNNLKKQVDEQGKTFWSIKSNGKTYKYYADFQQIPDDVWSDIPHLQQHDPQRKITSSYPTQKPEKLLERIIKASSQPGDIVLDAFAGSGTTLAVAQKLQRRWIGFDQSKLSLKTIKKRLFTLTHQIGSTKIDKRREHQRISDFTEHSISRSRGLFLIYDKARKGELIINNDFLKSLAAFLENHLRIKKKQTFSLCCPREKLQLQNFQISQKSREKAGSGSITINKIKFLISFIQPRNSTPKPAPLGIPKFAEITGIPVDNFPPIKPYINFSRALVSFLSHNKKCKFTGPDQRFFSIKDFGGYIWTPEKVIKAQDILPAVKGISADQIILIVPAWHSDLQENRFVFSHRTITVIEIPAFIFNNLEQPDKINYDHELRNNLNKINFPPIYSKKLSVKKNQFYLEISNLQFLLPQNDFMDKFPEYISISDYSDHKKIAKLFIPSAKQPETIVQKLNLFNNQPDSDSIPVFPEFIPISGADHKKVKFQLPEQKQISESLLCLTDKYGNEAREIINLDLHDISQP